MTLFPVAQLVPAPEPRGQRYGLLTAAVGPLNLPDPHGRGGGVQYDPGTCGRARRYPVECPDGQTPDAKTFDPGDTLVEGLPFVVYASYTCGSVGYTAAELVSKVERRLFNGEQAQVEAALADSLAASGGPALVAPDPTDIVTVVGELEQWLYGTSLYGNRGYLHVPFRASAYLIDRHQMYQEGPLWRTPLGTIVSIGNYPDGTLWISGQTTVWRAETPFTYPPEQTFDRTANQFNLLTEREYAVAFDCLAASAVFDAEAIS